MHFQLKLISVKFSPFSTIQNWKKYRYSCQAFFIDTLNLFKNVTYNPPVPEKQSICLPTPLGHISVNITHTDFMRTLYTTSNFSHMPI